jgi:hypothetical protein
MPDPGYDEVKSALERFEARVVLERRQAWLLPLKPRGFAVELREFSPGRWEASWNTFRLEFSAPPRDPALLGLAFPWFGGRDREQQALWGFWGHQEGSLGWALAMTGILSPEGAVQRIPLPLLLGAGPDVPRLGCALFNQAGKRSSRLAGALLRRLDREARRDAAGTARQVLDTLAEYDGHVYPDDADFHDRLLEWLERRPEVLEQVLAPRGGRAGKDWAYFFWNAVHQVAERLDTGAGRERDSRFFMAILANPALKRLNRSVAELAAFPENRPFLARLLRDGGYDSLEEARTAVRAQRSLKREPACGPEPIL